MNAIFKENTMKKPENEGKLIRVSDQYKKSNTLVGAKYKSTLIENKLLALSLSKADEMKSEEVMINGEKAKVFTSVMKSSEIINTIGLTSKNISSQLNAAYRKMQSRQIGIEDENGQFAYRSLFIGADYINGEFKLYYNPLLGNFYKEVKTNFTPLSLGVMMSFKSVHSFRLYELLRKECYITNKNAKVYEEEEGKIKYIFNYSVAELKLMLGVVNADSQAVRNALVSKKGAPDYEKAVDASVEKGFKRWSDFNRRCIEPAVKEINENTEMCVDYELEKSGQGGKVHSITFIVKVNTKPNKTESFDDKEKTMFINDVIDLIEEKIKTKDAKMIAETSGYDMDKIKKAYKIAKSSKNIENLVGFMIKAIKNDYNEAISIVSLNRAGSFGDYKQNDVDFEELSKKIYAN